MIDAYTCVGHLQIQNIKYRKPQIIYASNLVNFACQPFVAFNIEIFLNRNDFSTNIFANIM